MNLSELNSFNRDESLSYMERYVNDGSPSGFSDKHTSSQHTNPRSNVELFELVGIRCADSVEKAEFGSKCPDILRDFDLLIHPDMRNLDLWSEEFILSDSALTVTPTSSPRTVREVCNKKKYYKLHYQGMLGRQDRNLEIKHAQSAIEVSCELESAIFSKKLPPSFLFYRESYARVITIPSKDTKIADKKEYGIVVRDSVPFGNKAFHFVIPAFSLFSFDMFDPYKKTILEQLFNHQSKSIEDFIFDDLLKPIFDCYFSSLLSCGLQLEAHAQNVLICLNKDKEIVGVAFRDAESIDKDLTLIEKLKLDVSLSRNYYKEIHENDYNYQIMHSFMFDFKLGEYLITPIINSAKHFSKIKENRLYKKIKAYNKKKISQLPNDFFPKDGKWYNYANVVHDKSKKRDYISHNNPKYR
ncbi:hypothetical protein ACEWA2_05715 [Vibrio parahaemolyticus]